MGGIGMKRSAIGFGIAKILLAGILVAGMALRAPAQVVVRVPFVRVESGGPYGGTYVRAPFVRIFSPGPPPVYYGTPPIVVPPYGPMLGPGVQISPPTLSASPPQPGLPAPSTQEPPQADPPPPRPSPENLGPAENFPPAPSKSASVLSFDQFVKSFQPKAGSYEITVLNPLTQQPATVRFSLPPGTPERVL